MGGALIISLLAAGDRIEGTSSSANSELHALGVCSIRQVLTALASHPAARLHIVELLALFASQKTTRSPVINVGHAGAGILVCRGF